MSKAYQISPLRKQHGIAQRALAARMSLHEGELGKIENGVIPVTDEYAQTILDRLNEMIAEKKEVTAA